MEERTIHFNAFLVESIDETITALLSHQVAEALFEHLEAVHSITKDQVPYRLDTLLSTLQKALGPNSAKTVGRAIARRFYSKLRLELNEKPNHSFLEYVEEAKRKLQTLPSDN